MAGSQNVRRQAPFLLGLVLILAALPLGYFLFLREPPAPPPPPPPVVAPAPVVEQAPEPVVRQLEISEVRGTVEVRRGGGPWEVVSPGAKLQATDSVRTRDGSYAVLIGGEAVTVNMEAGAEVSVEVLTDSLSQILLNNGMATAVVRPGKRHTFEVKAANSDAVARATEGSFTMSNDGAGTVAVGTREGEVTFLGNGKVVIVRAGQQSVVRPGGAGPSEPAPVPTSLLRKVKWPGTLQKQKEVLVEGEAEPGTQLEIKGASFFPDKDGKFKRRIVLSEGENQVDLRARAVTGASQEASQKIKVDTRAPAVRVEDPWGNQGGQ